MESVLVFAFEKATKNYWRYTQQGGINKIYLTPGTGNPPPIVKLVVNIPPQD